MMFKKIGVFLLILLLISSSTPSFSKENPYTFLIIYDTEKPYGGEDSTLNAVIKGILATSSKVKVRELNSYTEEDLINAKGIFLLVNKDDTGEKIKNSILKNYENKIALIFKGFLLDYSIPIEIKGENGSFLISSFIEDKYDINLERGSYIIFDKVYPYDDLPLLVEKADYLYSQGLPFLIGAMPVYTNTNEDAMKRYTEALRYCESKGGTVVIGENEIFSENVSEGELLEKQGEALEAFINHKVYPIGMNVRDFDLYSEDRKGFMSSSNTLILNGENSVKEINGGNMDIGPFSNVLIKVSSLNNSLGFTINNAAYILNHKSDMEDFKKSIYLIKSRGIEILDGENLYGSIKFNHNTITNNESGLMLNNHLVNKNTFIEKEALESSDENLDENTVDLTTFNKGIFLVTGVGTAIFIILFFIGLRIDRRKYYK